MLLLTLNIGLIFSDAFHDLLAFNLLFLIPGHLCLLNRPILPRPSLTLLHLSRRIMLQTVGCLLANVLFWHCVDHFQLWLLIDLVQGQ